MKAMPETVSPVTVTYEFSDASQCRCAIEAMVGALNGGPKSREISLAITKLQEAFMWLDEHNRRN